MKLLLVEDNLAMQTTLQRTFQRRGMQVVTCDDGNRALDRWRASVPDVVVLDLNLPGQDGLHVLAAARAEGLAAPVLILTARGAVGDRILGLNTGADDYLPKPFDLDELEARIRALARRVLPDAAPPEFCGMRVDAGSGSAPAAASAARDFRKASRRMNVSYGDGYDRTHRRGPSCQLAVGAPRENAGSSRREPWCRWHRLSA